MPGTPPRTVAEYLAVLPAERRAELSRVRKTIRANLPGGYKESVGWGMITWSVPLKAYPETYNGQPLCYAALGAQKHHLALYLMCAYMNPALLRRLRDGFTAAGKRLDMGKSCVRFRRAEDLALDVVGEVIAAVPMRKYIEAARAVKRR